jgi:hypothetical protein
MQMQKLICPSQCLRNCQIYDVRGQTQRTSRNWTRVNLFPSGMSIRCNWRLTGPFSTSLENPSQKLNSLSYILDIFRSPIFYFLCILLRMSLLLSTATHLTHILRTTEKCINLLSLAHYSSMRMLYPEQSHCRKLFRCPMTSATNASQSSSYSILQLREYMVSVSYVKEY